MIDVYYWPTPNGHRITMLRRRRRLLDRGHCHLSLDRTVGNAAAKPRRLSGPEALVRGHRLATFDPSRVRSEGRIQQNPRR